MLNPGASLLPITIRWECIAVVAAHTTEYKSFYFESSCNYFIVTPTVQNLEIQNVTKPDYLLIKYLYTNTNVYTHLKS